MPTLRYHGGSVQTDDDGFLLNGTQWTPEIADVIAKGSGIDRLTDRHWKVIALCREDAARSGRALDARRISRLAHLEKTELIRLFPGRPERLIARIAGLPCPDQLKEPTGDDRGRN